MLNIALNLGSVTWVSHSLEVLSSQASLTMEHSFDYLLKVLFYFLMHFDNMITAYFNIVPNL